MTSLLRAWSNVPFAYLHLGIVVTYLLLVDVLSASSYAWTVLNCSSCAAHIGWRFTRIPTVTSNIHGAPRTFWGICRSSILPAVARSEDPKVGHHSKVAHH